MKRHVVVTAIAEQDVREIAAYIFKRRRNCRPAFPRGVYAGHRAPWRFSWHRYPLIDGDRSILGMRVSHRFRRYTVVYKRTAEHRVVVLRVVHNARDIQTIVDRL